ncbi:MAG TPA: hypothetical protein DIS98_00310 [Colwellia sp.]|nr:hypothetical protein [Colwellia sp.]
MKAPLYDDILAICQEIANASNTDNDELRLASCKKLQVLCAINQDSPKDHPLQWEALADFTEDGEQAMDIYEVALVTAEKLVLPIFTASAYLAMAQRQVEFEEKAQALVFATKANEVAQTIDNKELKIEVTDFLAKLSQD